MSSKILILGFLFTVYFHVTLGVSDDLYWMMRRPTCSKDGRDINFMEKCIISDVNLTSASNFEYNGGKYRAAQIKVLTFNNTKMSSLPKLLFRKFSGVKTFYCVDCGLREINFNDLRLVGQLNVLNLAHNNIETLEENCFSVAKYIQDLNLTDNKLTDASWAAFKPLLKLRVWNLANNNLTTMLPENFKNKVNLAELNLSGNNIETVSPDVFEMCLNLSIVDLSANKLKQFSLNEFPKLFQSLNISRNLLNVCEISCDVTSLDASNNEIKSFSLKSPSKLAELRLQRNKLENVDFISEMVNLEYLDISQNTLSSFNSTTLLQLTNLKFLFLENINLTSIIYQTFSQQTLLITLDISYNPIASIDLHDFGELTNLRQLFIDGNRLTQIDDFSDFELYLPQLKLIGISNNLFSCPHLRSLLKKFLSLGIEINKEANVYFANQTYVRGIGCMNQNSADSVLANMSASSNHHLPGHTNVVAHMEYEAETKLIRAALNASALDKIKLENYYDVMENISQAMQTLMELEKQQILADNSTLLPIGSRELQIGEGIKNISETLSDFYALMTEVEVGHRSRSESSSLRMGDENSANKDIATIKTMLILIFIVAIAVIVSIAVKTVIIYYNRGYKIRTSSSNAVLLEDRLSIR